MFYKKAILIAPDYVEAYLNLGAVYRTQGSYEDAIGEYKEAIRIDPDDAMAHYNLGDIYYSKVRLIKRSSSSKKLFALPLKTQRYIISSLVYFLLITKNLLL